MLRLYSISQIGLARLVAFDRIVSQTTIGQIEKLIPGQLPIRFSFGVVFDRGAEMFQQPDLFDQCQSANKFKGFINIGQSRLHPSKCD